MFDHLFENRNTTVTHLLKLGDCLGRSLRENIELFSIESEDKKVAYLTETGKVISGSYSFEGSLSLKNISVQESKMFEDNKIFDSFVDQKISSFVGNINSDSITEASESFSNVLSLWESRLKFENVKKKLHEKVDVFSESQNILNTDEFSRFIELMPQFMDFLEENKERIVSVKEVINSTKLSNSVSKAFNFPKMSFEDIQESGEYVVSDGLNKNIYEMVCKQELIRKELLESKSEFDSVWATNAKVRNLGTLIFEDSDEVVLESLVEASIEVPYLTLCTKRQLKECITDACDILEYSPKIEKTIAEFSSRLYEMKKPLKASLISVLNEKYGVNVTNLKDSSSFSSLAKTQVILFECLGRLAKKGSVLKESLFDVAKILKTKNGVEVIDVNDIIVECFNVCNLGGLTESISISDSLDFDKVFFDNVSPKDLLESAKDKLLLDKERSLEKEGEMEDDSMRIADKNSRKKKKGKAPKAVKPEDEGDDYEDGEEDDPKMDKSKVSPPKKVKPVKPVKEEEEPVAPETAVEDNPEQEAPEEDKGDALESEDFIKALSSLEDLLDNMKDDSDEEDEDSTEEEEEEEDSPEATDSK